MDGCTQRLSYGTKKGGFCFRHAKDGTINIHSKRCEQHGCQKEPSYGVERRKRAVLCTHHAKDGMVN